MFLDSVWLFRFFFFFFLDDLGLKVVIEANPPT